MLTFAFDIVCPYAYIAASRIEAVAAAHRREVRWQPVLLGGLFQHHDAPQVPADTWPAEKVALGRKDILRAADEAGVPLEIPDAHPRRTVDAMRLCVAAPDSLRPAVAQALYAAYWVEGRDVSDPAVLAEIAARFGLPHHAWRTDAARAELRASTQQAAEAGAFGVPTIWVGDRMFWGADRLHFVEEALSGRRVAPAAPMGASAQKIGFYHDFASPFSYLGATQAARVAARHGAEIEWRPFLLGALFRDIGTPMVPLATFSAVKQQHLLGDLHRWADHWGEGFAFPACFPVRTVLALRVALQAPEVTLPLYRALWVDGRDLSDPAVVAAVLSAEGLDPAPLLEGAQAPAVKQRLIDNGALARASGVVGVPTFELDDGMLIWGQDRIFQLDRALSGWRPRPEAC